MLRAAGSLGLLAHLCLIAPYGVITDLGLLAAVVTGLYLGLSVKLKGLPDVSPA